MLKSRQELIDIRKEYAKYLTAQQHKILVCAGTGCIASGSLKVYAEFKRLLEQKGLPCLVELKKENEQLRRFVESIPQEIRQAFQERQREQSAKAPQR